MKPVWLAAAGLAMAASAWAQRPPIQETPLPPLNRQMQQPGSPPVSQGQDSPSGLGPGAPGQSQAPAPPPTVVERPNVWTQAGAVKLQALDKVNAQSTTMTIKVGQSATFGSLTITAKACVIRPADQPADAAALLAVTDSHPDSPGFDGWMLQAEPSVSMMQHPIYDLRVTGCA
jgi:hypothetical protein